MTMPAAIGFIGLGVMGEPICRNLARKSGSPVIGFDRDAAPLDRLRPPACGARRRSRR
jgi:3-hydroxyisobutyrate dehydrogenase-like beta-hydroxyacid dehydrogenase